MTDYTDPESPVADPHTESMRLGFTPDPRTAHTTCLHCKLFQRSHINDRFCPEWRLRQLDGDR